MDTQEFCDAVEEMVSELSAMIRSIKTVKSNAYIRDDIDSDIRQIQFYNNELFLLHGKYANQFVQDRSQENP